MDCVFHVANETETKKLKGRNVEAVLFTMGLHSAIVSQETFDTVQRVLSGRIPMPIATAIFEAMGVAGKCVDSICTTNLTSELEAIVVNSGVGPSR